MRLDPIRVVPHDPAWAGSFAAEAVRLADALGPWLARPVEHIGSTAVPLLAAKPIIDVLAVVEALPPDDALTGALAAVGWVVAPEPSDAVARKRSYCTPSVALRTHHLHVVERSSGDWLGWLAFRDHLRANPADAAAYGALKASLAERHGDDPNQRDAYRAGKAGWIAATTASALRR